MLSADPFHFSVSVRIGFVSRCSSLVYIYVLIDSQRLASICNHTDEHMFDSCRMARLMSYVIGVIYFNLVLSSRIFAIQQYSNASD